MGHGEVVGRRSDKQDFSALFVLDNCQLDGLPYLNPVKSINGELKIEHNKLSAQNLTFEALDLPFHLKSTLENFKEPTVISSLSSENLNIESDIKIVKDAININSIEAKLQEGSIHAEGKIDTREKGDPLVNLKFNIKSNPKDIAKFLTGKPKKILEKII